jgi:hypothetical protein
MALTEMIHIESLNGLFTDVILIWTSKKYQAHRLIILI